MGDETTTQQTLYKDLQNQLTKQYLVLQCNESILSMKKSKVEKDIAHV